MTPNPPTSPFEQAPFDTSHLDGCYSAGSDSRGVSWTMGMRRFTLAASSR
jgi:hypothetical protein